ncbi:hypothetical protein ACVIW2_005357 [Bradyrhizobium huanghuaihaiense]
MPKDPSGLSRQVLQERRDRVNKSLGLIDVDGVPSGGDHDLLCAWDLGGHVVGRGEERHVIGANHDQRRHLDIREQFDHARIALGQHAACSKRQTLGVAMTGRGAFARRLLQHVEAFAVEPVGGGERPCVPGLARIILLEAGAGVDDQQRASALRIGAIEGERHVAAERKAADDGALRADGIEDRCHVADRERFAIGRGIIGIIGLAVAAHVPQDQLVIPRERIDLAVPHRRGRGVAVGEQKRRPLAMDFVVDADAVPIDPRHCFPPLLVSRSF